MTTALSNNEQIDFIDTRIFNYDVAEHKSESVHVPSLRTINKLMDEIENETKQENNFAAVTETRLTEKVEKFIAQPVCVAKAFYMFPSIPKQKKDNFLGL